MAFEFMFWTVYPTDLQGDESGQLLPAGKGKMWIICSPFQPLESRSTVGLKTLYLLSHPVTSQ